MHPNTPPPFEIVLKKMELAYGIQAVLDEHIPRLQHGHDGLIFTCCKSGYVPGTDPKMYVPIVVSSLVSFFASFSLQWLAMAEFTFLPLPFVATLTLPSHPSHWNPSLCTSLLLSFLLISLKWKPPSENSIDFKLELRFPSLAPQPSPGDFPASSSALSPDGIDYSMKPIFWLYQWLGGEEYERFEQMTVEDEEWEE
jgi:hypothetical protein